MLADTTNHAGGRRRSLNAGVGWAGLQALLLDAYTGHDGGVAASLEDEQHSEALAPARLRMRCLGMVGPLTSSARASLVANERCAATRGPRLASLTG